MNHDRRALRWWNGKRWSIAAYPHNEKWIAEECARTPAATFHEIKWLPRPDNWPAASYT